MKVDDAIQKLMNWVIFDISIKKEDVTDIVLLITKLALNQKVKEEK